jgi:hypothetical protein
MNESSTILTILYTFLVLLIFILLVALASSKLRKYGGSFSSTTLFGASDAFLDKNKRNAAEMVVELKANKKLEEQTSGDKEKK